MDQQRILRDILEWAALSANIRVVVLTGSIARGPEHVNPLSDIDIELYVRDPAELLADDTWYQQFGEVLVVEALPNPGWHPIRLVYYVGAKVDFMIASIRTLKRTTYERPFQVLLDKMGSPHTYPLSSQLLRHHRHKTTSWSASIGSTRRRSCAPNALSVMNRGSLSTATGI